MTQYQPDVVSAERHQPGTVSVAGMLLGLVAASNALSLIVTIATFDEVTADVRDSIQRNASASGATASDVESLAHTALGIQIAISGILAVLFALLAFFVLRGRQGMRVTAWVFAGIGVVCAGFGVLGTASPWVSTTDSSGNVYRTGTVGPSWAADISTVQWVVVLISLIVIIVLLALPSSNAYFRKPQAMLYPMMGPGGFVYGLPGGYAAYPGQAYPAQPYPAQPYPAQPYPAQPYPAQPYPAAQDQPPPTQVDNVWPPPPPQ